MWLQYQIFLSIAFIHRVITTCYHSRGTWCISSFEWEGQTTITCDNDQWEYPSSGDCGKKRCQDGFPKYWDCCKDGNSLCCDALDYHQCYGDDGCGYSGRWYAAGAMISVINKTSCSGTSTWIGNCKKCNDAAEPIEIVCNGECPSDTKCLKSASSGKYGCYGDDGCEYNDRWYAAGVMIKVKKKEECLTLSKWKGTCLKCSDDAQLIDDECSGECSSDKSCLRDADGSRVRCRRMFSLIGNVIGGDYDGTYFMDYLVLDALTSAVITLIVIAMCLSVYYMRNKGKGWKRVANEEI